MIQEREACEVLSARDGSYDGDGGIFYIGLKPSAVKYRLTKRNSAVIDSRASVILAGPLERRL